VKPTNRIFQPAVIALIALSAIWGYNWVVMKECLRYAGAFDFVALRTSLGTVALFALMLGKGIPLRPQELSWTVLLGLLATTGCIGFATLALVAGGVGKTAILVYMMPFFTLIVARPLLKESIRGLQWLSVLLAFTGLIIILEPWSLQSTPLSNLFALLSAVTWSASAIVTKVMRRKRDFDLISLTAWQMLCGSIPLALLALTVPERPIDWSGYFIGALVYSSVISQAVAFLLWLYILGKLSTGVASMGTLATPVIGVLSASLELGERPSLLEAAGMLLILSALALLSFQGLRQLGRLKPSAPAVPREAADAKR
jgi:drug/metabolite transporter (DMT)-like permease